MRSWLVGSCVAVAGLVLIQQTMLSSSIPPDREQRFASQLKAAEAEVDDPSQALQQVEGIPTNSQSFSEAQTVEQMLLPDVLESANSLAQQGQFERAIALLNSTPASIPGSRATAGLIQEWSSDLRQVNAIQQLIKLHRSSEAISQIDRLREQALYDNPAVQDLRTEAEHQQLSTTLVTNTLR